MRQTLFVTAVCVLASAAVAGNGKFQPLNIKSGQWLVTETYSVSGLPADTPASAQTINYKSCVTNKDLATNPFNDPNEKCNWTVLSSTGSDMEVRGNSCSLADMKANVHLKLHVTDSEHVEGTGEWTASGSGQSLSGNARGSGKWIATTCSAE